jgi:lipopolysaccharide transport system ATP-binding protein
MSEIVIKAENLGKSYIIGHESKEKYTALRDVLTNKIKQLAGKTHQLIKGNQLIAGNELEEFWALKDINFEINQGDRIGIIGRNGAGKSTLLKVLSRITEPTSGRISIRGRVASLLEVGTGFHPELTGRENIYLNGAILGMSRVEIKKKFDEIVDFSGVEKFLDTPVKRYSSGMYVRLAFAVAAHLEPEILVVDEVLAVGDAEFQKKCLGKMEDVSNKEGRTVIFVSHNMGAVRSLCKKGFLLKTGTLQFDGLVERCIEKYESLFLDSNDTIWYNAEKNQFEAYLVSISILDSNLNLKRSFYNSEKIMIRMEVSVNENIKDLKIGFDLLSKGVVVFRSQQVDDLQKDEFKKGEIILFDCIIPEWILNVGDYFIRPIFSIHLIKGLSIVSDTILSFSIKIDNSKTNYHTVLKEENHPGVIFPQLKWQINDKSNNFPY